MEKAGVITGYHATVDPAALGRSVAALVGIHLSDTSDQGAVEVELSRLEEKWRSGRPLGEMPVTLSEFSECGWRVTRFPRGDPVDSPRR